MGDFLKCNYVAGLYGWSYGHGNPLLYVHLKTGIPLEEIKKLDTMSVEDWCAKHNITISENAKQELKRLGL